MNYCWSDEVLDPKGVLIKGLKLIYKALARFSESEQLAFKYMVEQGGNICVWSLVCMAMCGHSQVCINELCCS